MVDKLEFLQDTTFHFGVTYPWMPKELKIWLRWATFDQLGDLLFLQIESNMEQRMETTIREQYGYEAQFNDDNAIVTKAWDKAQTSVSTTVVTGFT